MANNISNILGQILVIFAFSLLSPIISFAQETSEIKSSAIVGKVVDENKDGIPGASVCIKNKFYKDSEGVEAYTACNDNGHFKLYANPHPNYTLIVSSIGYENYMYDLSLTADTTINLGDIVLKPTATELQTVFVEGRAFDIKMNADGFSMNVEHLAPVTNNIFDLLGRLPQVSTIGEKLKVAGKDEVIVKINNVQQRVSGEQLIAVLKSFDSTLAKSVAIILNPPLRYDPEGHTAMIVVHMNSFFNKYMGGMLTATGRKAPRYNFLWDAKGTLTYNRNNLFMSLTPSYTDDAVSGEENTHDTFTDGSEHLFPMRYKRRQKSAGGSFTTQYQYQKDSYFGSAINYSYSDSYYTSSGLDEFIPQTNSLLDAFRSSRQTSKPQKVTATAYLEHACSSKVTMWVDAFYTYSYGGNTKYDYHSNLKSNGIENLNFYRRDNLIGNLAGLTNDYSINIDNDGKYLIEAGINANYGHTRQENSYSQTIPLPELNDDVLKLDEWDINPYVSTTMAFSHGFRMRAELRVPMVIRSLKLKDMTEIDKNYVNWLPSFSLSWQPNFSHRISARINSWARQPHYNYLNPAIQRSSSIELSEGNPNLKSSYTYTYELEYTYNGVLNISGNITQGFGGIERVRIFNEKTGIFIDRPENAQNSVKYYANASYYFNRLWWMLFQVSGRVGYAKYRSRITGISSSGDGIEWGIDANLNFFFDKPRKYSCVLYGSFDGGKNTAYSVTDPSWYGGVQFIGNFLQRRLTVVLFGGGYSRHKGYTKTYNSKLTFNNMQGSPAFGISLSWRFCNVSQKEITRQLSSKDASSRL